jgi:hypothetical protein
MLMLAAEIDLLCAVTSTQPLPITTEASQQDFV